jgi:hypothetical protein
MRTDRKADKLPPVPIVNSTILILTTKESNTFIMSENSSIPYENSFKDRSTANAMVKKVLRVTKVDVLVSTRPLSDKIIVLASTKQSIRLS